MPVVLTGCLDKWPAYGKWSIDFFRANYADAKVGYIYSRPAPTLHPLPHLRTVGTAGPGASAGCIVAPARLLRGLLPTRARVNIQRQRQ